MGDKKNNIVVQAGIMAAAGFISRIIGLIYVIPLNRIIGSLGTGYYQTAYNYYTIILLISSYSIPSAVSKVIAGKLSLREYKNAHRIFVCSMWYVLGVGALASLFLYFGANFITEGAAASVLKVFAPTIFFYGILGVLRGYFQAHKSMLQTSVSQILEQILNAIVSVAAAYGVISIVMGTMETSSEVELMSKRAMYGAMGSAIGTGAGVLCALFFMWFVYELNKSMIHKRIRRDTTEHVDSYREIGKMILSVVTPFILSTAAYNLNAVLNNNLYISIMMNVKNVEETVVYYNYGVFNIQAVKISNIPIAFASAMAAAIIPTITQLVAKKDVIGVKDKIGQAIRTIMLITIPSAVGLMVLAKPITWMLFGDIETLEMASRLLSFVAVSIVLFAFSTLNSSILQGIGKVNKPIINAVIALILQTGVVVPLLIFTNLDIYTLVISNMVYAGILCILNQYAIRKAIGYRQEMIKTFLIPTIASIMMGVVCWAVYEVIYLATDSMKIAVIPAIIVAVVAYFVLIIGLKGVSKRDLKAFPKGTVLVRIAQKMRLMN